jgi:hypothetical protein
MAGKFSSVAKFVSVRRLNLVAVGKNISNSGNYGLTTIKKEGLTMSEFYYDEELALVYKISPVVASIVEDEDQGVPTAILVHTNVKVTNFRREKVRRTLSHIYPNNEYDMESAKKEFEQTVLAKLLGKATPIPQDEYDRIKKRVEPTNYSSCAN